MIFKVVSISEKGRELSADKTQEFSAEMVLATNGYSIQFLAGRTENYNDDHAVVSGWTPQGLRFEFPGDEVFRWKPSALSVGPKAPTVYSVTTRQCALVKRLFPEADLIGASRTIRIGSVTRAVQVHEIRYKGVWIGSCGRGRYEHLTACSPKPKLVVDRKSLNFFPSGLLYQGSSRFLDTVN